MTRFVLLKDLEGKERQVNPDRVAYVEKITAGVAVVFEGLQGGLHRLVVAGERDQVVERLVGVPPLRVRGSVPLERSPRATGAVSKPGGKARSAPKAT